MTSPYGRSPAELALEDCREMSLRLERLMIFGGLPHGVTVYRRMGENGAWRWLRLPDPEKVK